MNILITYYSYSGITAKVVDMFKRILEKKGRVTTQRLRPKKEITTFAGQCIAARFGRRCELEGEVLFDVAAYDLIVIGLPVWAFAPVPAINTYLDKISGLRGKNFVVLVTSGSGIGVNMCLGKINNILRHKGVSGIKQVNIPNAKMDNKDFIVSSLEGTLQPNPKHPTGFGRHED